MENLPIVHMLDRKANLRKVVEDGLFAQVLDLARLGVLLPQFVEVLLKGPIVAVVHHDVEHAALVAVHLLEADDVWVTQHFEDLGLLRRQFAHLLGHRVDLDLFDDGA